MHSDQVNGISSPGSHVHNLDQFLEFTIEKAVRIMQAKAGSLLLLDQNTETLYFKVATGEKKDEVKKFEVKLGQGIAGKVAQTGVPMIIPDVSEDPQWNRDISESIGIQTQSIACAPMKVGDEIIGVVETIDKIDGSPFLDTDLKILTEFGELAAHAIGNAKKIVQVNRENKNLKEELGLKYQIVGESQAVKKIINEATKVANSEATTLILGESGTGKELLARMIHRLSVRKDKPMIVLNCAALPESLLEDELFGHEKGAYTGAMGSKNGKFELADEGTIFLDEIGEMSPGMQAKLLRVLQEGMFYRVGGNKPIFVNVRVISATNRDIVKDVEDGNFREDLYYRLNVVKIQMPALRERRDDLSHLAKYFLDMFKRERGLPDLTISKEAMEKIMQYDWPGNVRELRNALERAVVMGDGQEVLPEDLPITDPKMKYPGLQVGLTLNEALNSFKKEFIKLNLSSTGGNRSQAAKVMGIQRTYLSRLITKYDLH
ncbi:MAG: GAF domain-containing protein [Desulfobacula sp.]|nr:GAF domain-containing protein [Desulfobacula sp.]